MSRIPPPADAPATRTGSKYSALKDGSKWWMRNNEPGSDPYVAVHLVGGLDAKGTVLVKDEEENETRVPARMLEGLLYPMNMDQEPDCALLAHLSEAALLANLLTRDGLTLPYTTTGNVLTSINPCKPVPELYSVDTMKQYVGSRPTACPPHLYAVAEQAYKSLSRDGASQAIVVSGVSGAGKTEANKHIMQYLCWRAGQSPASAAKPSSGVSMERRHGTVNQCPWAMPRVWHTSLGGAHLSAPSGPPLPGEEAGPLAAQPPPQVPERAGAASTLSDSPAARASRPGAQLSEVSLSEVSRCVLQSSVVFELSASHVHFVRCVKPNDGLAPGAPDAGLVLDQLRFSGMLEAVNLISSGYPGRIPFVEIHERFQGKLPRDIMRMSPGDFVRAVVDAVGIAPGEYQIGKSRLFFRTGGADFLKELQHADGDEAGLVLKWSDPLGGPPEGSGATGIALAEMRAVSGALNFSLLKKITGALMGFEGKSSGIKGHFALRTKCCFTVGGPRRGLDMQAPTEGLKDEWVSALKIMATYAKLGSLATHAERAKLEDALVSRRFVRQAGESRASGRPAASQKPKRAGFLSFAPKHLQEWSDNFGTPRSGKQPIRRAVSQSLRKTKSHFGALSDAPRASALELIEPCD